MLEAYRYGLTRQLEFTTSSRLPKSGGPLVPPECSGFVAENGGEIPEPCWRVIVYEVVKAIMMAVRMNWADFCVFF
jgi:hypothetical protein